MPFKHKLDKLLYFAFIFFSLFGPKMGYIDTSIVAQITAIFLLKNNIRVLIPRIYVVSVLLIILYVIYVQLVYILCSSSDTYVLLRTYRALISFVLIGLVIINVPECTLTTLRYVYASLLIHACILISQIFIPGTKYFWALIYNYYKPMLSLRAFGLTGGYDGAGILCISGLLLSIVIYLNSSNEKFHYLSMLVFYVASIFTGRTGMLISSSIIIVFSIKFIITPGIMNRILHFLLITIIIFSWFIYVYPIIYSTSIASILPYSIPTNERYYSIFNAFGISYYGSSINSLTSSMWLFPEDLILLFFGASFDPDFSDIGFVKLIYISGILGALLLCNFYFGLFRNVYNMRKALISYSNFDLHSYNIISILAFYFYSLYFVMIMYNFKSFYFLSRGFTELIYIIYFTTISYFTSRKRSRLSHSI